MTALHRTPVVILNGFLGAGKTTLFRHLLSQTSAHEARLCAIVNDMSELDVDGDLIANTGVVENNHSLMRSISSCVLASEQGLLQLKGALESLVEQHQPDVIIIETSGSCHPMPLIEFFQHKTEFKLTGVFVLVDSVMLAHDYRHGADLIPTMKHNVSRNIRDTTNLLVEQILFCSHLLLTKADRLGDGAVQEIAQAIAPINPFVGVQSVPFGQLPLEQILTLPEYDFHRVAQLMEELAPELATDATSGHSYQMTSRVIKDDRPFHPQRLWDVCQNHLEQGIYRSKGFFWLASRPNLSLVWHQAAGSINLEVTGFWRASVLDDPDHGLSEQEIDLLKQRLAKETGRFGDRHCHLTVIGDKDQVDRFTDTLTTCFLTDEEIAQYLQGHVFDDPWPSRIVNRYG